MSNRLTAPFDWIKEDEEKALRLREIKSQNELVTALKAKEVVFPDQIEKLCDSGKGLVERHPDHVRALVGFPQIAEELISYKGKMYRLSPRKICEWIKQEDGSDFKESTIRQAFKK